MSRPVFWALSLPALLVALVSWRVFFLPMDLVMPEMGAYLRDVPLGVWGHVIFAPIALALVPLQLRRAKGALHRWAGRAYGVSVLVAGIAALSLLPVSVASDLARWGFGVLAVLWIATTALGIAAARRGDFAAHRVWMLRSVALTFAAVSLRVIMAPLMALGWTVAETYQVTAWGSWLLTLAVVEIARKR
ncbi:DUF2306 domain-containing protein [Stagnihabitans tardus]|uniref:DUF2306 domain-containing protein n=1 Tax=Stagnihabitans tardus TaxID=2699202 RepID=A0AAE4YB87_9RHOB|nr:DUF2306 domain-containing protein [Stagnihabitans tardus]NBZ87089.1 DUF2306 domain-containing protein [Stagnihabitans tardus]